MKLGQVAAQGYTVRDYCQSVAGWVESLKRIRAIGYEALQISGGLALPAPELRKLLDDADLKCCAIHEPGEQIFNNTNAVAERCLQLGTKYVAYPWPAGVDFSTTAAVRDLIASLDRAGAQLRAQGVTLLYHNHHIEFQKTDGQIIMERIYDEIKPENLQGEPDVYWIQTGGASPVEWVKKLAGRLPVLHAKDYGIHNAGSVAPCMREIGQGNLDWKAIVREFDAAGCEWFVVEQDNNWINNDPFESLRVSFDYIKGNLV